MKGRVTRLNRFDSIPIAPGITKELIKLSDKIQDVGIKNRLVDLMNPLVSTRLKAVDLKEELIKEMKQTLLYQAVISLLLQATFIE